MKPSGQFFPSARVGPYEIASRLGRGFVSEVWLAYRPAGDGRMQAVALKRLHHRDPALDRSFLEAIRRAELLDHPNLVHVFSSFELQGEAIAVLEMVDGLNVLELIDARMRAGGPMDPKQAVWIARECMRAAFELQSQITGATLDHGHLAPSNVLLSRDGVVRLSDFILARTTNDPRLVGDLARPVERDPVSIARVLIGLLGLVQPAELPVAALIGRAEALGRASILEFVKRCLAPESSKQLRALEEDLGRIFYAELGAHEIKDGTPAISSLVRALLPSVEAERARLDTTGFTPFARSDESLAPTIATKATFGFTQMLEARAELVVPSPLTARDIPTGFTRDVDLARGGLPVTSGSVLAAQSDPNLSEASTDEDVPAETTPDGGGLEKSVELRTPALPPRAHQNPPPSLSSGSNPGRVGVTVSSEMKVGLMQRIAPIALAFSVGVAGTAIVFSYLVLPRGPSAPSIVEPQKLEDPRPVAVPAPVPQIEPASDLETRLTQIEAMPAGDAGRAALIEGAVKELRSKLEASSLDEKTKKKTSRYIDEGLLRGDPVSLFKAHRLLIAPRREKLPPAEEL